jgi:Cu/Ag efflux pump CusA
MTASNAGLQAPIISIAIRFRGVVIALGSVLLIYGVYALTQAKYDVFPEFAPPQVSVQTETPGLTAEPVEILVTQPLENNLNGSPGLNTLRSTSIQGLSIITITFDPGSNIYLDRQFVAERLTVASGQLPAGVHAPAMTPLGPHARGRLSVWLWRQFFWFRGSQRYGPHGKNSRFSFRPNLWRYR